MIIKDFDLREINTWTKFHDYFSKFPGFPYYYGKNLNAWIDVVQDLEDSTYLIRVQVGGDLNELHKNEFYVAILDCVAFINMRKLDDGSNMFISVACNVTA